MMFGRPDLVGFEAALSMLSEHREVIVQTVEPVGCNLVRSYRTWQFRILDIANIKIREASSEEDTHLPWPAFVHSLKAKRLEIHRRLFVHNKSHRRSTNLCTAPTRPNSAKPAKSMKPVGCIFRDSPDVSFLLRQAKAWVDAESRTQP